MLKLFTILLLLPSTTASAALYSSSCDTLTCTLLTNANKDISSIKSSLASLTPYPSLGATSDNIATAALESFESDTPRSDSDETAAIYSEKLSDLERMIDQPLQTLYYRQLSLLREKAINQYNKNVKSGSMTEYEAMKLSDDDFVTGAEEATRTGSPQWDYTQERRALQTTLASLSAGSKKVVDVQLKSASQQSTAMQYLQMQQQQLQQLQMQLYGQSSPWNLGFAYRVPDTNLNLQGQYQQGKTNVQVSCVADEYASMLGPNGFTNGVGPGNLGLSLNLNM